MMQTFTTITNVEYYGTLLEDAGEGSTTWTINRKASVGDRVLLYCCAPISSIVAVATIAEEPFPEEDINSAWFNTWFADMNELRMLNSPIPRQHLLEKFPGWRYWRQPRVGILVPPVFCLELEAMLAKDADIPGFIRKRQTSYTHHVYERANGHEWCLPNKTVSWPYCHMCGLIRRADLTSNPCKGLAKLSLRGEN